MFDYCWNTLGISGNEDRISTSDAIWAESGSIRGINSRNFISF